MKRPQSYISRVESGEYRLDILEELVGGIKVGMGYIGAGTIEDMPKQARFIQITGAGLKESHPHSLV